MNVEEFQTPDALAASGAKVAVVLGSGLGPFADSLEHDCAVGFHEIPGLPVSRVPGHAGRFLLARIDGIPIVIAQGRVHLYEGWTAEEVARNITFFHAIGIEMVLLTNAAGAVNPAFCPGGWMMISDHINLTGTSPLHGGPNFFDMSAVYCAKARGVFRSHAGRLGIGLFEGVYGALPGPQFETPAEIRMLRFLGVDATGMSTVHEAIQARALGLRVAAFSCLTNWGAGLSDQLLSHDDVTATGRAAAAEFAGLFRAALPDLVATV